MLINVVATIMKRTKINDYCALYSVSKTTTGHYDDEMNVIIILVCVEFSVEFIVSNI